jgi:1,4-alpha-glucan branching enzyme
MLAQHGIEYFVADAHLVAAGRPVFPYRDYFGLPGSLEDTSPSVQGAPRSPYHTYRVASRGGTGSAVAFFRDPRTTLQVWSRDHGYPGEYAYLEFHKKHWPGGLKLWRITDNKRDLATKTFYDPAYALQKVRAHARHFAELVQDTLAKESGSGPATVCSPYDAELFGHWWFEGPPWLEQIAREMHRLGVGRMTMAETLGAVPPALTVSLPEGSWGEGGDHRVWLNRDTEWTWDRVYSAEAEWITMVAELGASPVDR